DTTRAPVADRDAEFLCLVMEAALLLFHELTHAAQLTSIFSQDADLDSVPACDEDWFANMAENTARWALYQRFPQAANDPLCSCNYADIDSLFMASKLVDPC